MKRDLNLTVTLSEDDIKEAIAQYVHRSLDLSPAKIVYANDVNINVSTQLTGFGMGEHQEIVIENATVKVQGE